MLRFHLLVSAREKGKRLHLPSECFHEIEEGKGVDTFFPGKRKGAKRLSSNKKFIRTPVRGGAISPFRDFPTRKNRGKDPRLPSANSYQGTGIILSARTTAIKERKGAHLRSRGRKEKKEGPSPRGHIISGAGSCPPWERESEVPFGPRDPHPPLYREGKESTFFMVYCSLHEEGGGNVSFSPIREKGDTFPVSFINAPPKGAPSLSLRNGKKRGEVSLLVGLRWKGGSKAIDYRFARREGGRGNFLLLILHPAHKSVPFYSEKGKEKAWRPVGENGCRASIGTGGGEGLESRGEESVTG